MLRGNLVVPLKNLIVVCFLCMAFRGENPALIKLAGLQELISKGKNPIAVINFWATWCGPCVKEMPLFETLYSNQKNIDVALISMDLDLDRDVEKVNRFVERKKIACPVFILDEVNPDEWISKIDKSWSGALPATLLINRETGVRKFIERELHNGELENLVEEIKRTKSK